MEVQIAQMRAGQKYAHIPISIMFRKILSRKSIFDTWLLGNYPDSTLGIYAVNITLSATN